MEKNENKAVVSISPFPYLSSATVGQYKHVQNSVLE